MNVIKTITTAALMATTVLAGCDDVPTPVEPEPIPATTPERTVLFDILLVGHEQHDLSFVSEVPVGDTVAEADSLLVLTTDLLGTTTTLLTSRQPAATAPLFSTSSTSSSSATIQDNEKIDVTGTIVTKTEKRTYSDGTSEWHTSTTTSDFVARGRKSGAECRSNETANFQADNPGGATTFTQVAQSVLVCPGDGRQLLVHLNLHFTVTPNGKVTSSVQNIKVKGNSGT